MDVSEDDPVQNAESEPDRLPGGEAQKEDKSKTGNFSQTEDVETMGYPPMVIRYLETVGPLDEDSEWMDIS